MNFRSPCLQELYDRGFVHQCTDFEKLDEAMCKGKIRGYVGFDPTAKSLHVGNLVSIMMLRVFQRHGHQPIVIVGGATAKVCDPSGKDEMRRALTDDEIKENVRSILSIYSSFISFGDGPSEAFTLDNADWLDQLKYLEFLRDYGPLFTINRMLSFDSVKLRLEREQSLSFLEFNYMLLQAYDFQYLNNKYNCILQMGGSDQWGNIVNGVELIRRKHNKESFGLTSPLITAASGEKMGKSAGNAVWLKEDMLPAYDYWQFWRNVHDADVGRFLRLFTDLPLEEIKRLEALEGAALNDAKIVLANEATKLARGEHVLPSIHQTVASLFTENDSGYEITGHRADGTPEIKTSLPVTELAASNFPMGAVDLFTLSGLVASKSEARRSIQGGSLKIDDQRVEDITATVDLSASGVLKLSHGKKRHAIVLITKG